MIAPHSSSEEYMAAPSIAERIETELATYLKRDRQRITPSHSLRDDLGLDSMATIELLFRIEEAFDLQIPDQDLQKFLTVGDVVAYVEDKVPHATGVRPTRPAATKPARGVPRKKSPRSKKT